MNLCIFESLTSIFFLVVSFWRSLLFHPFIDSLIDSFIHSFMGLATRIKFLLSICAQLGDTSK
jgi:hypothetical protein